MDALDADLVVADFLDRAGVPPIDRFSERIYVGDMRGARDHDALRSRNITAVMNLTSYDYGAGSAGFRTHTLGVPDRKEVEPVALSTFLEVMDEWWAAEECIFVHCAAGISRTAAFLICWLMHTRGACAESDLNREWQAMEAAVRSRRSIVMPHPLLKGSIVAYFKYRDLAEV